MFENRYKPVFMILDNDPDTTGQRHNTVYNVPHATPDKAYHTYMLEYMRNKTMIDQGAYQYLTYIRNL